MRAAPPGAAAPSGAGAAETAPHVEPMPSKPFWVVKTLAEMSVAEWESLCDGCGRCCLHKLRDEDTDALAYTNVSCRLLDGASCRCSDYARRQERVPDCVSLTPAALADIDWLPPSCAYRRVAEGRGLAWWHPLVSGSPDTVHEAGVSVRGRVVNERVAGALEDHVVSWPDREPRARRPATAPHGARSAADLVRGASPGEPVLVDAGSPDLSLQMPPASSAPPDVSD
jgi:uncharacterized cysteine cluster protein YcgN (CxxCxxCC family)